MNLADLERYLNKVEDSVRLLEKAVSELIVRTDRVEQDHRESPTGMMQSDIAVLKSTQKLIGWICGLLLTGNGVLLAFVLYNLVQLTKQIK